MSWDKDSLWAKSRIFFEKAFQEDKEQIFFGLFCAMGLEVLSRAAISRISPTLLADPDKDQQNLLHALNLGSAKVQKKSVGTAQVLLLCKALIPEFTEDHLKIASAITNRRNEEVHTGSAAFLDYKTQYWIEGFYKCCKVLAESLGETLETLFDEEEAEVANLIISETETKVTEKTKSLIAAHTKVFEAKTEDEIQELRAEAEKQGEILSHNKHHKVTCPACSSVATTQGEIYGKDVIEHADDEIIVRQAVIPTKFQCIACGLKLNGYGPLSIAGIGEHFTHRTNFTPGEYYDLISLDDTEAFSKRAEELGYFHFSND
ncbi:hypothetical protein [Hymenobacter jeollabukensis]|uniref:DUF4145 domain-containing protein n=1 Tax=Hymenobacter jeollabukensis TaxID=2025313 RepID=A0A5R8WL32_9BACT|nr:hypothetical protein [Hymenobacter jeollabukensis]TLM89798.1 hypothetical protein FDY95_19505 [Hymenobacter jeollabukensis]